MAEICIVWEQRERKASQQQHAMVTVRTKASSSDSSLCCETPVVLRLFTHLLLPNNMVDGTKRESEGEIESELEAHRLDTQPPNRGHCQRCVQKNRKRAHLGVRNFERSRLVDGERARFLAAAVGSGWRVRDLLHSEHDQPPFGDMEHSRAKQAYAIANVDRRAGKLRLRNVTVEQHSPLGAGPMNPVVAERFEEPGEWVTNLEAEEPHPLWPEETREWLAELVEEHGPVGTAEASEEAMSP